MTRERENWSPRFSTTSWAQVAAAGSSDPEERCQALEALLLRYQGPLKAYLTRKYRFTEDQTADLFQEFVCRKVLAQNLMRRADRKRGRFRTFLLKALDNSVLNEFRKAKARKRLPDGGLVSLDDVAESDLATADESSTSRFIEDWARTAIAEALERMRRECLANGRAHVWDVFESRELRVVVHGLEPISYGELVKRHGFKSPVEAYNARAAGRESFMRKVREVVAEYEESEADVEADLADWLRGLRRAQEDKQDSV